MKRLLAGLGIALAALTMAACGSSGQGSTPAPAALRDPSRPNIVFVLTDDLSLNLVSHMPHVLQMQRSGMSMSRYYVVDSLCCPSRASIFTGEFPHNTGVFTNSGSDGGYNAYNSHGDEQKSFALALQRRGYRTGFMGKYLNLYSPTDPVPPGWDEWDGTGSAYKEYDYRLNENGDVVHYGARPQDYLTDVLRHKAVHFIDTADKPFMLEVATFSPHTPYVPAPRDIGSARGVAYPRTPAFGATVTDPIAWLGHRPPLTARHIAKLTADYDKRVEAVKSVDDMIGSIQRTLRARGIADNTYLVFSSDNGYHMGEYRLAEGKQTAFDTDIHVPLVVVGPRVPAGRVDDHLTSNIDLAPTFESVAGASVGADVDGVSMAPLWHAELTAGWRQGVLIEHHGPDSLPGDPDAQNPTAGSPRSYEAVRTADALYVEYVTGEREYYDTRSDPYELHNLAGRGVPAALPRMLHALEQCRGSARCTRATATP